MTHLLALTGILLISLSPLYVALADVSPLTAAFFRCAYALPVLFVLRARADRRPWHARRLSLLAGVFLAFDLLSWHWSIELIGAGLATILANTQVLFVGLVAWAVHGERPRTEALVTLPIVLGGVGLISGLGRDDAFGQAPLAGAALGLAAGALYGSFLLLLRASNRDLAPAAGPLFDATLGAAATALVFGVFDDGFQLSPSWPAHGYLLALALGSQVAGWLLIARTLPRLPALETSVLLLLQPTLALGLARVVLGERMSAIQLAGIVIVIAGVTWVALRGAASKGEGRRWKFRNAISRTRASSSGA